VDKLFTTKEAAHYLGVSKAFLERDRWAGAKIEFIQVSSRTIRYQKSDLDAYINAHRYRSTAQADQARQD